MVKRYHPVLVLMHWLMAFMILMGLVMGTFLLSETPNSDPQKITFLKIHMLMGMLIGVLMLIRIAIKVFSQKPSATSSTSVLVNKLGVIIHNAFYLVVLLIVISGFATANIANLPDIIFKGADLPLPESFDEIPPRVAHGILTVVLGILILIHSGAAFYHQFIFKDQLLSRMWFGKRN